MAADCNYTPNELAEQNRALSLNKSMKKMQKVYPNDPCPSGSGKNTRNTVREKLEE